jgi:hypothetical protein
MHERAELTPALDDLLVVPPELLKQTRAAEHELRRAWLSALGLGPTAAGLAAAPGAEVGLAPAAAGPERGRGGVGAGGGVRAIARALERHSRCVEALTAVGRHAAGQQPAQPQPPGGASAVLPRAPPAAASQAAARTDLAEPDGRAEKRRDRKAAKRHAQPNGTRLGPGGHGAAGTGREAAAGDGAAASSRAQKRVRAEYNNGNC